MPFVVDSGSSLGCLVNMRHTASSWWKYHGISQFSDTLKKKKRHLGSLVDLDEAMDDLEFLSLLSLPLKCWVIHGYQHA